ncbi:hypothetical protein NQ318_013355 [Aromia moschata]|uniref:Methionine--tRNA ligase, cytoplasmic n=1 Tax=Aromia moschata TaxID=1265417 RepID=A0AAV8XWK1_9CUCU|nr:hypothetical protein NQ318_013355 [Aromia moschata]
MFVIYSNENNPAALKLIIAKNFTNAKVDLKLVNLNDCSLRQPKHLPYLELHDDQILFMPNSAALYLFPPSDDFSPEINELLEWEATALSPTLAFLFGNSLKNEKLKGSLQGLLKKLDKKLENKHFLVGDSVTCADIVVWSILYPLYKCETLSKEHLSNFSNISKWMMKLESEIHFKNALDIFKMESGQTAYVALLSGAKYLSLSIASEPQVKEKDSPQHQVDTVTDEELDAAEKAWKKDHAQLPKLKEQKKVVLPVPGEKNIFITSALPYVNNVPHLGNIIGCVLSADVFARFSRLCNHNTLFICGTDEYGTATETKALEEGLSCKQICDKYFKIHRDIYKWFNISFDHFGRTSQPEQTQLCQDLFLQLNSNGFMFTQSVEQLHCEKCDRYLADRFVEGGCPNVGCTYEDARGDQCDGCGKLVNAVELKNPRCKICGSSPKLKSSNQFFIDLPKLEPLLHHWIKLSSPGWSNNAQVIAKSWLREGLKPRCITRDLKWGVPVPMDGFRDKVFYVWFDAPIGYMSISKSYTGNYEKWWRPQKGTDVTLYNFMAKDNVPFHSILFPAMLLGANRGYVTVSHIMATEYLNYEDGKFSKSRGVGVFGNNAQDTGIPSDVWRFYLLYVRPESQDSSFSWSDLATKNNSELLNNLGNFINRALVFAKNNFDKTVPKMVLTKVDYTLLALCTRELKGYVAALEKAKLRDGIRHILSISRHGNQYMQANQPWVLLKGSEDDKIRAGTVIGVCSNLACLLATLLHPYMPNTSASLQKQLNTTNVVITPRYVLYIIPQFGDYHPFTLRTQAGGSIAAFAKIEAATVEELKKRFAGKQETTPDKAKQKKSEAMPKNNSIPNVPANALDVKTIENEVAKQADKVRKLKTSGAEKSVWQPEVAILLDLKKKLELAQKSGSDPVRNSVGQTEQNNSADPKAVKQLEEAVAKQGSVVRELKQSGAEKSAWQPEVDKLLALKKQLAVASGEPLSTPRRVRRAKSETDLGKYT